jgi:hypothetical protein
MERRMRRLAIAVFVALLLAGCGADDAREPGGGTGPTTTEQSGPYDY